MLVIEADVDSKSSETFLVPSLPIGDVVRILQLDDFSDSKLPSISFTTISMNLRSSLGFFNDPVVKNIIRDSTQFSCRLESFLLDQDTVALSFMTDSLETNRIGANRMIPIPKKVNGSFGAELVEIGTTHRLTIWPDSISHIDSDELELIVLRILQSFGNHIKGFVGGLGGLEINSMRSESIQFRVNMPVNQTLEISCLKFC